MIRAFVDTSVLFAACYSATGASREIVRLAVGGRVELVISDLVKEEARRNLSKKAPQAVALLDTLLAIVPFEEVTASEAEVREAQQYTELKDAPIVAAARAAKVDYLVTLDKVHLVDVRQVAEEAAIPIVLPRTLLEVLRDRNEHQP